MITWRYIKSISSIVLTGLLAVSCFQSEYTRLVKSELAKGVRQDSIVLGIRFGDTKNDYFGKCYDLNKQHLVTQGSRGIAVQYLFRDSLFHREPASIRLLFSPYFDNSNVLSNMDLEFSYTAWAPWNRPLQSDSLQKKVTRILMHWYGGNDFIQVKLDSAEVPIKLDGNRRMIVNMKDNQTVLVNVQDILHPKFIHSISRKKENGEAN